MVATMAKALIVMKFLKNIEALQLKPAWNMMGGTMKRKKV
jgi:hypothetical protein